MISERQVMSSYNPDENQGALERLGIPVQTTPPEQILTAGKAKSIRFRVSRPHGYSYGDVESYHFDYVIPTLDWYSETLHQRDLAIHKLGEMIDKLEVDLLNAKAQLDHKDYNDALGLAVEEASQDPEIDRLIARVESLQHQLAQTNAALEEARNAPFSSPDGEETYTRADVEGFLASAVEDANNAKDAHFQTVLAQKDHEFTALLEQARAEAHAEGAKEAEQAAVEVTPTGYTEEELETSIHEAVTKALAEAVPVAVAEAEKAKDFQYTSLLESQAAALQEAETRAQNAEQAVQEAETRAQNAEQTAREAEQAAADATPTGYSQEELDEAVATAVAAKETELRAEFAEAQPVDQISELTNEGDLNLHAEVKTLRKSNEDLDEYAKQLEAYIAQLEGNVIEAPAPATQASNHGRPLPKLRPEDL